MDIIVKIGIALIFIVIGVFMELRFGDKMENDDWNDWYWMYMLAAWSNVSIFVGVMIILSLF